MSKIIGQIRLGRDKVKKLISGKGIKVSNADATNESNPLYDIEFNSRKHITRLQKAFDKNKSAIINKSHIVDIVDSSSGGSIMTGLQLAKKIGHTLGKPLSKVTKPSLGVSLNPFDLGYQLGHDVIAPALIKAGVPRYNAGSGLKEDVIAVAKKVAKRGKAAAKSVVQEGKDIYRRHKGQIDTIAKKMALEAADAYINEPEGLKTVGMVKAAEKAASNLGEVVIKDQLKRHGLEQIASEMPTKRTKAEQFRITHGPVAKARPIYDQYSSEDSEALGGSLTSNPFMLGGRHLNNNASIQGVNKAGKRIKGGSFALPGRQGGSFVLPSGGGFVQV